jgi:16S rRNA (cytosine967-C5)-methyltransferase
MTPGARVAAAIAVIDQIKRGTAAEKALTAWARSSRFAGAKDRAAVRDHVFDVLRARRSLGDGDGRSLMQRLALREGWALPDLFSGIGHAPAPLSAAEEAALKTPLTRDEAAACDVPDWLWPHWQDSLQVAAATVAQAQQGRADVFLRVNRQQASVDEAMARLAQEEIATLPHPTIAGCLRVTENPRRVKTSQAYLEGWIELQDASSQFAIAAVPLAQSDRVLDYCAGGGGKALGFADRAQAGVFAHDIDPRRMVDLPQRAKRAGVQVTTLPPGKCDQAAPFDVVFCDAPCSGAGTWRRTPDAKWRLTEQGLEGLMQSQDEVLAAAAPLVADGGLLVYATCSVLDCENEERIDVFLSKNPDWSKLRAEQVLPSMDGDGFFFAFLERAKNNL